MFYTQSIFSSPHFIPSPYFTPSPQSVVRSPCIILTGHAMTFGPELRPLRLVFSRLCAAKLKLSPEKCELFRRKVKFLGHVVCEDGVTTDPDKV